MGTWLCWRLWLEDSVDRASDRFHDPALTPRLVHHRIILDTCCMSDETQWTNMFVHRGGDYQMVGDTSITIDSASESRSCPHPETLSEKSFGSGR